MCFRFCKGKEEVVIVSFSLDFILGNKVYCFPAANRLKNRADFMRIQATGVKYRSSCYFLICAKREAGLCSDVVSFPLVSRLGLTVTKKIDKRAVVRNFIKRRWREFFRTRKFRIEDGWDLVVVALRGSVEQEHNDFVREAYYLLKRSSLLKER